MAKDFMDHNLTSQLQEYIRYYFNQQNFIPLSKSNKTAKALLPIKSNSFDKTTPKIASNLDLTLQDYKHLPRVKNDNEVKINDYNLPLVKNDNEVKINISESLDSLRLRIHGCQECNLCLSRKNIVYGQGNQRANLLIIGEAPGAQEDKDGIPFVGKAGKLLDKMLLGIAIAREAVYITNIVKCRPPNNRDPLLKEMLTCSKILEKQINFIAPKFIVVLGSVALRWMFPQETGVSKNHGKVFSYISKGVAIPTISTFHPAYLLRRPEELSVAWQDFRKIRQLIVKLKVV